MPSGEQLLRGASGESSRQGWAGMGRHEHTGTVGCVQSCCLLSMRRNSSVAPTAAGPSQRAGPQLSNGHRHAWISQKQAHAAFALVLVVHKQVVGGQVLDHQLNIYRKRRVGGIRGAQKGRQRWSTCQTWEPVLGCWLAARRAWLANKPGPRGLPLQSQKTSAPPAPTFGGVDLVQLSQQRGHLACGSGRWRRGGSVGRLAAMPWKGAEAVEPTASPCITAAGGSALEMNCMDRNWRCAGSGARLQAVACGGTLHR